MSLIACVHAPLKALAGIFCMRLLSCRSLGNAQGMETHIQIPKNVSRCPSVFMRLQHQVVGGRVHLGEIGQGHDSRVGDDPAKGTAPPSAQKVAAVMCVLLITKTCTFSELLC